MDECHAVDVEESPISAMEINKIMKSLKNSNCLGSDGLVAEQVNSSVTLSLSVSVSLCLSLSSRLIESSLGSMATKFNFFIHNLAQLRFSGLPASDEPILSFSPRTYSMKQDGRVLQASIFSFQKRYSPDKHYVSHAGNRDDLSYVLWSGGRLV